MARISGLEKKDAPWHLRWLYGVMRQMFGKDFTPAKIQVRLPGLVWGESDNLIKEQYHKPSERPEGTPSPVSMGADEARPPSVCRQLGPD
jgi:hypothetical protein